MKYAETGIIISLLCFVIDVRAVQQFSDIVGISFWRRRCKYSALLKPAAVSGTPRFF